MTAAENSCVPATSRVACSFGSSKLYICLSNKCFKVYPAYSLCDRHKTLTGSPDPTYMQLVDEPCTRTRTPWDQTPPRTRHPPGQTLPQDQTPPPQIFLIFLDFLKKNFLIFFWIFKIFFCIQPPSNGEADSGSWSTSGRYTSYWNAFLFIHKLSQYLV